MTAAIVELIRRCQVVAGHFCDANPRTLVVEIRALAAKLPNAVSRADQFVVTEVLDRALAQLVGVAGLNSRPDIAHQFIALVTARCTFEAWQKQWLQLVDLCAAILCREAAAGVPCHSDPRVDRMLEFVDQHYADTRLGIRTVADVANVSSWHAARLLKEKTGLGFLAHLHRRRIAVARDLLVDSSLSIKEISTAIGYAHPSQFTRHFRAASGTTPLAYRASRSAPSTPA